MHVITFEHDHPHPEQHDGKNRILSFLSSSVRLAQHSLDVSPWLTYKSAPFCHTQVYNLSVFNERHFDHCQFYKCCTPTALIEDAILNLEVLCVHAQ